MSDRQELSEASASASAKATAATLEVKGVSRSLFQDSMYRLFRNKAAVAGMVIVLIFWPWACG